MFLHSEVGRIELQGHIHASHPNALLIASLNEDGRIAHPVLSLITVTEYQPKIQ